MSGVNLPYRYKYEHVAASQTNRILGGVGAKGDYLHRLVCTVTTVASAVSVTDGALPSHSLIAVNTPIGVYDVELNINSANGAWKITTGAGVEVIAVGIFSA